MMDWNGMYFFFGTLFGGVVASIVVCLVKEHKGGKSVMGDKKAKRLAHEAATQKASLFIQRSALLAGEVNKTWDILYNREYDRVYAKLTGTENEALRSKSGPIHTIRLGGGGEGRWDLKASNEPDD